MAHTPIIPMRQTVHVTASGAQFIIPDAENLEGISEHTLRSVFPIIVRGDLHNGIAYNPLTDWCELRINGEIVAMEASIVACERKAGKTFPLPAAPRPAAADSTVSAPRCPRVARDDWERARFGFFAAAREHGIMATRMETNDEREARLACMAAWLGLPELESIGDLGAAQIDSVSRAIRSGEILPGWNIRMEVAA